MAYYSAFWFYMWPQSPKPSMHDALLGFFEPSQADIDANICTECFGTTSNIINGAECGVENSGMQTKADFFRDLTAEFDADYDTTNRECVDQGSFTEYSGGAINHWLAKDEYDINTCKVVSYQTEYTVYRINDYKRCVCDNWDPTNPDCMG